MPVFAYKALDADESAVAGEVAADSPRQARDLLRAKGLTVQAVAVRAAAARGALWRRRGRQAEQVTTFLGDLATLLSAGVPLLEALDTLSVQQPRAVRAAALALREQVAAGAGLAEAMEKDPACFDELAVSMVGVGQSAGTLEAALASLADFRERSHRLRGRVGTALLYPALVATVGVAVTVFLMTFVVPKLLSTLGEGRPLPAPTRIVKAASDGLVHYGWIALPAAAGLAILFGLAVRDPRGRLLWHRLMLRLPLLGPVLRKDAIARFAGVMAGLLRSGVVFVQALAVARGTLRNEVFRRAIRRCEAAVTAGKDLAEPLRADGVFPPMVVQMMAVGQQAGELEAMLERLAGAYHHQVETLTARLTAVLEPVLILVLALAVGFVVFATILPILEASNVL